MNDKYIKNLVENYFTNTHQTVIKKGKSGYNNTTRYVERSGQNYILRIYETHQDLRKVQVEHEVLLKLHEQKSPYQIPLPIPSLTGETVVIEKETGKLISMFHYIEGENPSLSKEKIVYSYGQTVATLLKTLESITISREPLYRPYYEIENSYPNCPIDMVLEWCENPPKPFKHLENELQRLIQELILFRQSVPFLKTLPHQIIHGDINESNILSKTGDSVDAILDFEFVTFDLRVMEPAVCLAELLLTASSNTFLKLAQSFILGFSSILKLTKEEVECIHILFKLRRLDVFVHFLSRFLKEIDDASILEEQIKKTANHLNNLEYYGNVLAEFWIKKI
ncbi:phosphotransferase [Bacillus solitudinis]|uniref:phosphotransferase n=1 Tax=Bacillus solitudinis TaxID=2014074 RepID=UPI0012FE780B|nr:phosphotransferase [Bacillus solitudinis]